MIVVGKALKYNEIFMTYLKSEIEKKIGSLDMVTFIAKGDEEIVSVIEESSKRYEILMIACVEGFELISKILSSISDDTIVVECEMLIPSKVLQQDRGSYQLSCNDALINVFKVDPLKELPHIFTENFAEYRLFLFSDDAVQIEDFEKLIQANALNFDKCYLIEGIVSYTLIAKKYQQIDHFLMQAVNQFEKQTVLSEDLSKHIVKILINNALRITCAESCTGGLLASELVKNSGISAVFDGSIVSYANEIKSRFAGVKEKTLQKYGAVSRECVKEMLDGVIETFDADFALAVSGVAGPDGGTKEKPVGTVYVGVKKRGENTIIKKLLLKGDRRYIQQSTVIWAFKLLIENSPEIFLKKFQKSLDK